MHDLGSYTLGPKNRYSAKRAAIPVNFVYYSPEAATVAVAGDFNNWSLEANMLSRRPDGSFGAQIELHHGHHQYIFIVDGVPTLDPRAQGVTRNAKGERVSMIAVS